MVWAYAPRERATVTAKADYASYEEILPLLDRPKKTGAWVMSFCPAHQDKIRSLGLSEKGILECFVSCSFKDIMTALRKGGGRSSPLTKPSSGSAPTRMAKDGPIPSGQMASQKESLPSSPLSPDTWSMIDLYEYRTQTGELIAEKSRWHNLSQATAEGKPMKKFLWRLPGRTGWSGFEGKLTTKDLPLFGIERLTQ